MEQIKVGIQGMSCQHCTNFVDKLLSQLEGIETREVDLKDASAKITFNPAIISSSKILDALKESPYQIEGLK